MLVVGGAPESLESRPGSYILKLKDRKGFIKTALRHGYVCRHVTWTSSLSAGFTGFDLGSKSDQLIGLSMHENFVKSVKISNLLDTLLFNLLYIFFNF